MIIVNFATGHYLKGQQRLKNSLNGHKTLMLSDYTSIGSPTHSESPYEFKIHAIEKALGFDDIVLWCDSSLWRVGDLSKIEKIIQEEGFFGEESGHYCRDWCNDNARKILNFNWDGSEHNYIMFSAGLVGLNKKHDHAMLWLQEWKSAARRGAFKGDWSNHRHDMVVGSILAQRLNFKFQRGGSHLAYIGPGYSQPEQGVVFYLQGI